MTQKELLYVEDAIAHEKNVSSYLEDAVENLEKEELVTFFEKELEKHTKLQQTLENLLEEVANND